MELSELNAPLDRPQFSSEQKKKKKIKHISTFKKNSLVSKSGVNFKSIDHFISESIIQSYYPKNNQEDLDLLYINPEDIEPDILDEQLRLEPTDQGKGCCQRCFGPINRGSLRSSIFALMACSLGAGSLALPKALFRNCGFGNGLFLIIFCGLAFLLCLKFLMKTSVKANISNYSELVEFCFSKKIAKLTEIVFIVYSFGTITGYQIIIGQFAMVSLKNFGVDPTLIDNNIWAKTIQVFLLCIIITPIALQTSFYSLRHASIMGVCSLIYAALVVISESPAYLHQYWNYENLDWFVWDWNLFTGFSTAVFSFTCTTVVLPVKSELINPSENRIMKIFTRSVFIEIFIYLAIGVSGYLSLLNKTPDIILDRPPLNGTPSVWIIIARVALILNLSISIPININPGRSHFFMLLKNKNPENSKVLHYILTFAFLYGSGALSIIFPDILAAFSFLGGACSVVIGITFPTLMWVKINDKKWCTLENLFNLFFCLVLTIIGLIAAFLSLLDAIQVIKL